MGDGGHTVQVPFQSRRVECYLCQPADLFPLCDWCDLYLHGDFHFKRRHLQNILTRGTSATWAIMVDGVFSGIVILYKNSVLHNMYLAQDVRSIGLGAAIIAVFQPAIIRSKTNMKDGDPTPFYEANGYTEVGRDKLRPHIAIMERSAGPAALPPAPPVDERPAPAPPSPVAAAADSACVASHAAETIAAAPPPLVPAHPLDAAQRRRIAATERSRRRRARLKSESESAAAAADGGELRAKVAAAADSAPLDHSWCIPSFSFTS